MRLFFALSFSAAIFLLGIQKGQCAHIIGGKESVPHSRPYMVALSQGPIGFYCGGSLINEYWVLTAAHCHVTEGTFAVLGAHKKEKKSERGRQHIKIARRFIHPKYNGKTFEHDIMLLKLKKKARIGQYVQPIQLPKTYRDVRPGTRCLVAGWGLTEQKRAADTLRETYVTVMDRRICNDRNHWKYEAIKKNMLCAGDLRGRKDTCSGDSGGPLLCNGEQKGIVSFNYKYGCADPKHPAGYTFLTYEHLKWVSSVIANNN